MEKELLINLGLTADEATIYNVLIEGGFMPARTIAIKASLGRPLTYKILDDLISKGIIEKKEVGSKIALFSPVHPRELEKLIEKKKEAIDNTKKALDDSIGQMISKYNLSIGKPNIQFFEGIEGAIKVTSDLPTESKEILSYLDSEKVINLLPEHNEKHSKMRAQTGIHKKMIVPNSEFNISRAKGYDKDQTETRVMAGSSSFPTAIQIYDNKISFLTLSKEKMIGVIVEDKDISQMMRNIFNSVWEKSNPID